MSRATHCSPARLAPRSPALPSTSRAGTPLVFPLKLLQLLPNRLQCHVWTVPVWIHW